MIRNEDYDAQCFEELLDLGSIISLSDLSD